MKKTLKLLTLISTLLSIGCSFDNRTGRVQFDLNPKSPAQKISKLSPTVIVGIYQNQTEVDNVDFDRMTVKHQKSGFYHIHIESVVGKGCQFDGVGVLRGHQVAIPLSRYDDSLSSAMIITFMSGKASISTDNPEKLSDLSYFCSTGTSLLADFRKVSQ